jgi:hypothetical protein
MSSSLICYNIYISKEWKTVANGEREEMIFLLNKIHVIRYLDWLKMNAVTLNAFHADKQMYFL